MRIINYLLEDNLSLGDRIMKNKLVFSAFVLTFLFSLSHSFASDECKSSKEVNDKEVVQQEIVKNFNDIYLRKKGK